MNTQLIADAVFNRRDNSEATVWDRLFALWFRRLVYNQIWEDPEADLAALELPPNATLVTISSAGCNALSYLLANPKQIYAADLNEAHLALLNLKIAGLRGLSEYDPFWRFFGAANSASNRELYREVLRPLLDAETRSFWDGRDLTARARYRYFCDGFYRHGALGRFIGFGHLIARLYRIDLQALLRGGAHDPDRCEALARLERLFQSRFARALTGIRPSCSASASPRSSGSSWQPGNSACATFCTNGFAGSSTIIRPLRTTLPGRRCSAAIPVRATPACRPICRSVTSSGCARAPMRWLPCTPISARCSSLCRPGMSMRSSSSIRRTGWRRKRSARSGGRSIAAARTTSGSFSARRARTPRWKAETFARCSGAGVVTRTRSAIGFAKDRSGIYGGFHLYRRR